MFFSDRHGSSQVKARQIPLFKTRETRIHFASDIPINGPTIKSIPPSDLGLQWTNTPFVSETVPGAGKLDEPNESFEKFMDTQSKPLIDPDALVICEMRDDLGNGLFTRRFIPEGRYIGGYFGVIFTTKDIDDGICDSHGTKVLSHASKSEEVDTKLVSSCEMIDSVGSMLQHLTGLAYGVEYVRAAANLDSEILIYHGIEFVVYKANRDILPDEILGINYGEEFWKGLGRKPRDLTRFGEVLPQADCDFSKDSVSNLKNSIDSAINATKNHPRKALPPEFFDQIAVQLIRLHYSILDFLTSIERDFLWKFQAELHRVLERLKHAANQLSDTTQFNKEEILGSPVSAIHYLKKLEKPLPLTFNTDRLYMAPLRDPASQAFSKKYYVEPILENADELGKLAFSFYGKVMIDKAIFNWLLALRIRKDYSFDHPNEFYWLLVERCKFPLSDTIATCCWNLGSAYLKLKDYVNAAYFLKRCLFSCRHEQATKVAKLAKTSAEVEERLNIALNGCGSSVVDDGKADISVIATVRTPK